MNDPASSRTGTGCAIGCLIVLLLLCAAPVIFMLLIFAQVIGTVGVALFAALVPMLTVPLKLICSTGPLALSGVIIACCVLAAVLIPVITFVIWVIKRLQGTTISPKGWATALCLWLLALICTICCGAYAIWHLPRVVNSDWHSILEQAADSLESQMNVDVFDWDEAEQLLDSATVNPSEGLLEITDEDLKNI